MKHTKANSRLLCESSRRGLTRADVVITSVVVVVLVCLSVCILSPVLRNVAMMKARLRCSTNLAEIGKAMLSYASDYDGVLPVAGGPGTVWGPGLEDWRADSREEVFGFDSNGTGGAATVSSSLYLLVRYAGLSPELFICSRDKGTTRFQAEKYGLDTEKLAALWDFGPDPACHCSYAYHMPYSQFHLTTSTGPDVAVAADRNPWMDGPQCRAAGFSRFKPDLTPFNATTEEARLGNSLVHESDGQNVLFLDSHVEFARRAFCGLEDDNVYTSWDSKDKARGVPPKPYQSQPASARDSLLLNDPPLKR